MSKLKSSQVDHNGQSLSAVVVSLEGAEAYTHPASHPVSMITNAMSTTEINTAITDAINGLVDGAPDALNTLNEIAESLADNPDLAAVVDSKAKFKIINATFLSGQTQLIVTDAMIEEATCKIDVDPQSEPTGSWTAEFVDGTLTVTSDATEASNVEAKIYIIKAGS